MLIKQKQSLLGFRPKIAAIDIFLVANAVVWYVSILAVLEDNIMYVGEDSWLEPNSQILIWCLHFAGLIFSALVGAKISKRINRTKFLLIWISLNVALSLTLFGLSYANPTITAFLVVLYGVSFGLGMPTCMSNYSDSVAIENRGRISGLVMLVSGIGIFAFSAAPLSLLELGVALFLWRLLSLVVFQAFRSSVVRNITKRAVSYKQVLSQRSFLAYYIPWLLFSLVNFLVPLQPTVSGKVAMDIYLIQTVFLGVFAVLGGFLLDTIGRKRIAITGFVMLGLAAAIRGINATNIVSIYFTAIFEGVAWGLLLVLFILTLWGDLSDSFHSDKYYAIGVIPFFVSLLILITIGNQITDNPQVNNAIFPFAAFFLFLAVLPLFYATETLPEKITKKRELDSYVAKALEKVSQEGKKSETKNFGETEEDNEKTKESREDEAARKLAEKYY